MRIKETLLRLRISPEGRYDNYLRRLEAISINNKHDQEKIEILRKTFNRLKNKIRTIRAIRGFFFIILYASVIISFINQLPIINNFTTIITAITGIIGTTISTIAVIITTRIINVLVADINMVASHMISIYVKNDEIKHETIREHLTTL